MRINILDTTLRDGEQGGVVSFTIEQKLDLCRKLDAFGIDYIEAGWPASNPKDAEFFRRARDIEWKHTKLVAFGGVRHKSFPMDQDPQVVAMLAAETRVVTCFANCLELADDPRALDRAVETVKYLCSHGREVFFDAQHFFDFYVADPGTAIRLLEETRAAGASVLCLCDTRGGTLTSRLAAICAEVRERIPGPLGIHAHNDIGLAVANTLAAVQEGFTQVQGCINGYGERCGNADLCAVIATLELKLGHHTVGRESLAGLSEVARCVADAANLPLRPDQPYVGAEAFTRVPFKNVAGHVEPTDVGNRARTIWAELPTGEEILRRIEAIPVGPLGDAALREAADRIFLLDTEGWDLDAAGGTLELIVRQAARPGVEYFHPGSMEISVRGTDEHTTLTRASITVEARGSALTATAEGDGSLHALDRALRQCLLPIYPQLAQLQLDNYQVRVLDPHRGTGARARVLLEWTTPQGSFVTTGVSENLITASWRALLDAVRLVLFRTADGGANLAMADQSWAV